MNDEAAMSRNTQGTATNDAEWQRFKRTNEPHPKPLVHPDTVELAPLTATVSRVPRAMRKLDPQLPANAFGSLGDVDLAEVIARLERLAERSAIASTRAALVRVAEAARIELKTRSLVQRERPHRRSPR